MDPITAAIIAALLAGAAAGATDVSRQAVTDGYAALKAMLKRKFSAAPQIHAAIAALESQPNSDGRKLTLFEEIAAAKADQDPELVDAAQDLLTKIKAAPGGEAITQSALGDFNIQIAGNNNIVTTNRT